MTSKTKDLIGRDAGTGRYIPVSQARANPRTTVVEPRGTPAKPTPAPRGRGK